MSMYPPIFATCAADSSVTALIGSSPVRLYPFDDAPQGVQKPYVVWQTIGGNPENYLGSLPDVDRFALQVDVYADSASEARAVAQAVRDAVEPVSYITRWGGETRDQETRDYRYSFDISWHVIR